MTTFPTGVASKPANIVDGLQILAAHVGSAWDEIVGLESELLGLGAGSFVMDLRPSAAGSVIFQLRQTSGDTQARFQLTGNGDLKWGTGTATQDVTLARTATRTVTLTGTEIITPGNSADKGLLIKGAASQSGLLFEVQDSAAASKFSITAAGVVTALTVAVTTAATAPTKAPGTNSTDVATTAFVTAAVTAGAGGVAAVPAGAMFPWAGSAAPAGYQLCDGTAISRTTFSTLFAVIASDYGPGDGSTTFNVPDCRGKTVIGAGTGAGLTNRVRATTGGNESNVLGIVNLPVHDHGAVTGSGTQTGTISSVSATGTISTAPTHTHGVFGQADAQWGHGGSTQTSTRISVEQNAGSGVTTGVMDIDAIIIDVISDPGGNHTHTWTPTAHSHTFTAGAAHTHSVAAQGSATPVTLMQPWLASNWIIKT